jgi:5-methylcytosine-specific restriction endonuclease McrA
MLTHQPLLKGLSLTMGQKKRRNTIKGSLRRFAYKLHREEFGEAFSGKLTALVEKLAGGEGSFSRGEAYAWLALRMKSSGGADFVSGLRCIPPERPKKAKRKKRPSDHFYRSKEWRALRYQVLKANGAKCQCCGRSAKDGAVMHVDHIKPRSKFPELELSLENLQVLCDCCNIGKSNKDDTDWR